jgi:tetratricopeptide (TPR) repeat protein
MDFHRKQIAPPKAWDEFEDLCLALCRAEWGDLNTDKNGRQGQPQAGVDVFGHNIKQGGGLWGVQCKQKNSGVGSKLTKNDITDELAKADTFQPKLAHWIMASTTATNAKLQEYVRQLSADRVAQGLCPVSVWFWETICALLPLHRNVAELHYPEHFRPIGQSGKPIHLPGIRLASHFSDPVGHLPRLRQQLAESGSSALLAAATVQGMGGVGKTQLALKYCLSYHDQYSGVWWLQAETENLLEQECVLFCAKQGLKLAQGESAISAMGDWLAGQTAASAPPARWLLVLDNVEDAKLIRALLPKCGAHHVLITSRLRDGWAGMAQCELDVWQEQDALPFLRARLGGVGALTGRAKVALAEAVEADDAPLRLLNQTLGGLPLALEQACAYINKHQVSIAAYCQRIQAQAGEIHLLDRNDSEFCPRSVLATLSLAVAKLSDAARQLLEICAWLAAEPIPEYLFTEPPPEWADALADALAEAMPHALQQAVCDEFAWRETVAELANHALCHARSERLTDHMGNGAQQVVCLHFHRLTQAALRAGNVAAGGTVLLLVRAAFPAGANSPEQPQHWPRCRTLAAHVQRLHEAYQPSWQQAAHHAGLLNQLAIYMRLGPGLIPQAESWQRQAWQIQQTELGEEHPATLTSISNLAETLRQMGDLPGARALQEQELAICRRVLGEEHPDTLTSIGNLAATLWQMGDLPGARALQEQELAIRRRVQGEEHPATLTSINNLATTLWKMGDLPGARALQEQVLAIRRRVLGEEHPDTLTSINNLAATLYDLGELRAAQALMQQAFTLLHRVLGPEHPDTIRVQKNLAIINAALGQTPA